MGFGFIINYMTLGTKYKVDLRKERDWRVGGFRKRRLPQKFVEKV